MEHTCINKEKFKNINQQFHKDEDKLNSINLETALNKSKINTLNLQVSIITSKIDKFNFMIITNLVGIIFLILGALGALLFFLITGGYNG